MIYVFDHCLTLSDEVHFVWRCRNISVATALYVLLHASMWLYIVLLMSLVALDIGCDVRKSLHHNTMLTDASSLAEVTYHVSLSWKIYV